MSPSFEPVGPLDLKNTLLAERMATDSGGMGGKYLYSPGLGWLRWSGMHWEVVTEDWVIQFATTWSRAFLERLVVAGTNAEIIRQATAYLSIGNVEKLVKAASTSPYILRDANEFDRHPDLFNCPNGVVDLRTGELLPHDQALMLTKLGTDPYRGLDFRHPDWDMALEALDPEEQDYLQGRTGQAMTGYPAPTDDLLIVQGSGENGKTVIFGALRKMMGTYAILVTHKVLTADPRSHSTELMDFKGIRFALMEETPEAKRLDVIKLKTIIGTDTIRARWIRKDTVEYPVTHSLIITTNYRPQVSETDHGTWRRLNLMRFGIKFVKTAAEVVEDYHRLGDPGLKQRLHAEVSEGRQAALSWSVAGAVRYYAAGKKMPAATERMLGAMQEWRSDADMVVSFLSAHLVADKDVMVLEEDLFNTFNMWLVLQGNSEWSLPTFKTRFFEHELVQRAGVRRVRRRNPQLSTPARNGLHPMVVPQTGQIRGLAGLRFASQTEDPRSSWGLRDNFGGTGGALEVVI
jgi:putative DNA primase/helicase